MFNPMPFQQSYPAQMVPQGPMVPSNPMVSANPVPPVQTLPATLPAPQNNPGLAWNAAPQPKIRMLAPEPPAPQAPLTPRRLVLPSPEQLGVRANSETTPANLPVANLQVDWNAARAQMQRLGVLSFRVDRLQEGGYRVAFLLPGWQPQQQQLIEAESATETGAVQLALQQAESRNR